MNRRNFMGLSLGALAAGAARAADVPLGRKGVMLMNRIAPSLSLIHISEPTRPY